MEAAIPRASSTSARIVEADAVRATLFELSALVERREAIVGQLQTACSTFSFLPLCTNVYHAGKSADQVFAEFLGGASGAGASSLASSPASTSSPPLPTTAPVLALSPSVSASSASIQSLLVELAASGDERQPPLLQALRAQHADLMRVVGGRQDAEVRERAFGATRAVVENVRLVLHCSARISWFS